MFNLTPQPYRVLGGESDKDVSWTL